MTRIELDNDGTITRTIDAGESGDILQDSMTDMAHVIAAEIGDMDTRLEDGMGGLGPDDWRSYLREQLKRRVLANLDRALMHYEAERREDRVIVEGK